MSKPPRKRIPRSNSDDAGNAPRREDDDRAYTSNYGQERPPARRTPYNKEGGSYKGGHREGKPFPRREGSDTPFNQERREKKSFGPRPDSSFRKGEERGSFRPKGNTPFSRKEEGFKGERSGDRKPFNRDAPREGGYKGNSYDKRKEYGSREDRGDRKPFNRDNDREGGDYKGNNYDERKAYGSREDRGDRKPFSNDTPREGGYKGNNYDERKAYTPREGSDERKPYSGQKRFDDKGGFKDQNRDDRKSFSRDSNRSAGGKPFGNKASSSRAGKRPPRAERFGAEGEERRPHRSENEGGEPYTRPSRRQEEKAIRTAEETGAGMTLNKYLSRSGICGRREGGEIVKRGDVKVNGKVETNPGYRVEETDIVVYEGRALKPQSAKVYVLLNKPRGFITTTDDEEDRRTVMDLVQGAAPERLYPVGRLDRNTTGVLLLTNDGDLAQRLTHPKYESKKIYQVTLDRDFEEEDFKKLEEGLPLEDGNAKPDALFYLESKTELGIEIHNGRNRIVRRMFEHLKYSVEKLDRVMFAGLTKKNVPRGKWRILTEKEVVLLKHFKS